MLRNDNETEKLTEVARIKLQTAGKRDDAKVLKEICSSPSRAHKFKIAYQQNQSESTEKLPI